MLKTEKGSPFVLSLHPSDLIYSCDPGGLDETRSVSG